MSGLNRELLRLLWHLLLLLLLRWEDEGVGGADRRAGDPALEVRRPEAAAHRLAVGGLRQLLRGSAHVVGQLLSGGHVLRLLHEVPAQSRRAAGDVLK